MMLDALVIGADSKIGKALLWRLQRYSQLSAAGTTRRVFGAGVLWFLDLLDPSPSLPHAKVVYICAAMTRFIDCEANPLAYRVNVDAPIRIAEMCQPAKVVYLSSEAVERAPHTLYGHYKALAELGLRTVCKPLIVRLSKVDDVEDCARFLASLADKPPGIYQWSNPTKPISNAA